VNGGEGRDAPGGVRAIHREAAPRLRASKRRSCTLETIVQAGIRPGIQTSIQAGHPGIPAVSDDVGATAPTRGSRLIRSVARSVLRPAPTIRRILVTCRSLRFLALRAAAPGIFVFVRLPALRAMAAVVFVGGAARRPGGSRPGAADLVLPTGARSRRLRAGIRRGGRQCGP